MAYYNGTSLVDLVGQLLRSRPGLDRFLARDLLNTRQRAVLDKRMWAGLQKQVNVSIPQRYMTGAVSVATGSKIVTGDGTNAFPIADVVNTVVPDQVNAPGQIWVTPASLDGITQNTIFYVDANGTPETCPVLDVLAGRVALLFQYPHVSNFTLTTSSLAGQQFRLGFNVPIFTVLAVKDSNTLLLDTPWGGAALTNAAYTISQMYVVLDPYLQSVIDGFDPVQMIPLKTAIPQVLLNRSDPTRTGQNSPVGISPRGPNVNGLPSFEIYPAQTTPYQLNFRVYCRWPDMRANSDTPPPFLNPNLLLYGALADAFRTPIPQGADKRDLGFSMGTSDRYEQLFKESFLAAIEADEALSQQAFTWDYTRGGNWFGDTQAGQSHDIDAVRGNF